MLPGLMQCHQALDSATKTLGASFEMTSFLLLKRSKVALVQKIPKRTTPLARPHVTLALPAPAGMLPTSC